MQNDDYPDGEDNENDDIQLSSTLASITSPNPQSCLVNASVNDVSIIGLLDTGADNSFVEKSFVINNSIKFNTSIKRDITLANNSTFSIQVPLRPCDYYLTGFEAVGKLYKFKRLPFGCTNAVPIFQRIINPFIKENHFQGTYAYLDDIIICGRTNQEHDERLQQFLALQIEIISREYRATVIFLQWERRVLYLSLIHI